MNNESFNNEKLREIVSKNVTDRISKVGKELVEFRSNLQQSAQTIIDDVSLILDSIENKVLQEIRAEFSEFEKRVRSKTELELRSLLEIEIRQRLEADLENQVSSARQAESNAAEKRLQSKLEILNRASQEISQQKTQVDILTCYLDKAALFVPRVALLVIKSGNIVGWQARGFEGDFKNDSIKSLVFSLDSDHFFRQVYESKLPLKEHAASKPAISETVAKFGPVTPDSIYACPLVIRDKTVAILYADSGLVPNSPVDSQALEVIARVVSLAVELSSVRAKLGVKPVAATAETQTKPESTKELNALDKMAQVSPPLIVEKPPAAAGDSSLKQSRPVQVTEGFREQVYASETVGSYETGPSSPLAGTPKAFSAPPAIETSWETKQPLQAPSFSYPPPGISDDTQQKLHNEARRFARLLVSEIKLYNEQKVHEGRRDKNLYGLLRDDIDKSREMYDKRVSPYVAAKIDYFYEELVRILADNQAEALGKDCPGPVLAR